MTNTNSLLQHSTIERVSSMWTGLITECFLWLSCSCNSWGPYQASPASMQPSSVSSQSTAHRGPGCWEMVPHQATEADYTQRSPYSTSDVFKGLRLCIVVKGIHLTATEWSHLSSLLLSKCSHTTEFAWYKSGPTVHTVFLTINTTGKFKTFNGLKELTNSLYLLHIRKQILFKWHILWTMSEQQQLQVNGKELITENNNSKND